MIRNKQAETSNSSSSHQLPAFMCRRRKGGTIDKRKKSGLEIKRLKFKSKSLLTNDWLFYFDLPWASVAISVEQK